MKNTIRVFHLLPKNRSEWLIKERRIARSCLALAIVANKARAFAAVVKKRSTSKSIKLQKRL